jgi:HPt (histidine-containing phosphotransfer) domain-containing protein
MEDRGVTPASPNVEPPLDAAALVERTAGDSGLLAEVIALFQEEAATLQAALQAAVAAGSAGPVEKTAHRLKGALLELTAKPAAAVAHELERMGRAGSLDGARDALERLGIALARTRDALGAMTR